MPKKRLTMRQIRELLRLKYGDSKQSDRAIALQLGVTRSTIQDYLARVDKAGLTWTIFPMTRSSSACSVAPTPRPGFGGVSNRSGRLWPAD